jgi:hypothetical protein
VPFPGSYDVVYTVSDFDKPLGQLIVAGDCSLLPAAALLNRCPTWGCDGAWDTFTCPLLLVQGTMAVALVPSPVSNAIGPRAELVRAEEEDEGGVVLSALLLLGDVGKQLDRTAMSLWLGPPATPRQLACDATVEWMVEAGPGVNVRCGLPATLGIEMSLTLWLATQPADPDVVSALNAVFSPPLTYPLLLATSPDTLSFPLQLQERTLVADNLGLIVRDVPLMLGIGARNLPAAALLSVDILGDDNTTILDACLVRRFLCLFDLDFSLNLSVLAIILCLIRAGEP